MNMAPQCPCAAQLALQGFALRRGYSLYGIIRQALVPGEDIAIMVRSGGSGALPHPSLYGIKVQALRDARCVVQEGVRAYSCPAAFGF